MSDDNRKMTEVERNLQDMKNSSGTESEGFEPEIAKIFRMLNDLTIGASNVANELELLERRVCGSVPDGDQTGVRTKPEGEGYIALFDFLVNGNASLLDKALNSLMHIKKTL